MKNLWAYDIEVAKNFWMINFMSSNGEIISFSSFDFNKNDFVSFIKGKLFFGYNSSNYDDLVVGEIFKNPEINNVFDISHSLIKIDKGEYNFHPLVVELRKKRVIQSVDLMQLNNFSLSFISLKDLAYTRYNEIYEEIPINWSEDQDFDSVYNYNVKDLEITRRLMMDSLDLINARDELEILYKQLYNNEKKFTYLTDSLIANEFLRSSIKKNDFIEWKKPNDDFNYHNEVLKEIENYVKSGFNKYSLEPREFNFDNYVIKVGVGGMHSNHESSYSYIGDATFIDFSSFYPSIMIHFNYLPTTQKFKDFYKYLIFERINLKKINPAKAGGMKIILNSVYGLLGSRGLTDFKYLSYFVCFTAQIIILRLVDSLIRSGYEIFDINTDGVAIKGKYTNDDLSKVVDYFRGGVFDLEVSSGKIVYANTSNYFFLEGEKAKEKGKFRFKDTKLKYQPNKARSFISRQILTNKIESSDMISFLQHLEIPSEYLILLKKGHIAHYSFFGKKHTHTTSFAELSKFIKEGYPEGDISVFYKIDFLMLMGKTFLEACELMGLFILPNGYIEIRNPSRFVLEECEKNGEYFIKKNEVIYARFIKTNFSFLENIEKIGDISFIFCLYNIKDFDIKRLTSKNPIYQSLKKLMEVANER